MIGTDLQDRRLMNEKDAARLIGMSVRYLQASRLLGGGPPYVKIGRSVRYAVNDLLLFISDNKRAGGVEAQAALSELTRWKPGF